MVIQILFPVLGAAICVLVYAQFAGWISLPFAGTAVAAGNPQRRSDREVKADRRRTDNFESHNSESQNPTPVGKRSDHPTRFSWRGFREFRVIRTEKETNDCTSVCLEPCDGKRIAEFKPGQHLTIRLVPGESRQPVTRCYSLSAGFHHRHYRITVKSVAPPADRPDLPEGKASNYINRNLRPGDLVEVKAPAGEFFLPPGNDPVVLLAAGVGITPMMSMIEDAVANESNRGMLLFYGVANSRNHIFARRLCEITERFRNITAINCYSGPLPDDTEKDFHHSGRVTIDLVKRVLPGPDFDYYLCGPPAFMESLYSGLTGWGVPEERIHFEAFGPATIRRLDRRDEAASEGASPGFAVKFAESGQTVDWDGKSGSLLDAAEHNSVWIDSGCRAGSCGTCSTRLLSGRVTNPDGTFVTSGSRCLPCIAVPASDIELEA